MASFIYPKKKEKSRDRNQMKMFYDAYVQPHRQSFKAIQDINDLK